MKRSGFKSQVYVPQPSAPARALEREPNYAPREPVAPIEKEGAIQHEGYMALVRTFHCARCTRPPPSEFSHADRDKGQGIKTDCRRGCPLCRECHVLMGSSGLVGKESRRVLEAVYAARTRAKVRALDKWPKNLPDLPELEDDPWLTSSAPTP